jgi:hypothetical protein
MRLSSALRLGRRGRASADRAGAQPTPQ